MSVFRVAQIVVKPCIQCDIRSYVLLDLVAEKTLRASLAEVSPHPYCCVAMNAAYCHYVCIERDCKFAGVSIKIAESRRWYMCDSIERMHSVQIEHLVSQVFRYAVASLPTGSAARRI